MPSYDFRCPECDERFEVTRPVGGTADVCCPDCGVPAKRVFTPVGVVFKGSGFHNTDYRKRPAADSSSADSGSGTKKETPPCGGGAADACASCPVAK